MLNLNRIDHEEGESTAAGIFEGSDSFATHSLMNETTVLRRVLSGIRKNTVGSRIERLEQDVDINN